MPKTNGALLALLLCQDKFVKYISECVCFDNIYHTKPYEISIKTYKNKNYKFDKERIIMY